MVRERLGTPGLEQWLPTSGARSICLIDRTQEIDLFNTLLWIFRFLLQ